MILSSPSSPSSPSSSSLRERLEKLKQEREPLEPSNSVPYWMILFLKITSKRNYFQELNSFMWFYSKDWYLLKAKQRRLTIQELILLLEALMKSSQPMEAARYRLVNMAAAVEVLPQEDFTKLMNALRNLRNLNETAG